MDWIIQYDPGNQLTPLTLPQSFFLSSFPAVDWIIQYDPPDDPKEYIHRVGRCVCLGGGIRAWGAVGAGWAAEERGRGQGEAGT